MNFLNRQTKSVSFASLILAGSYLLSAALGLLRDHLLAGKFGLGHELDVYYAAFTIPDFIALILIFGAISAAIVPIFSSELTRSKEEAWRYVSNLLNIFLSCLIFVSLIFVIFAPFFVRFIAPGFSPQDQATTVMLMRIMFLSPILLGASHIMSAILQVFHRFLVTAAAPLMYNIGIIIGIIFFVPMFGLKGLAFGVVLGALLHLLIQLPVFFHSGFRHTNNFNVTNPGVVKTLKLMVPRSLGLAAGQLNTIVITAIASTLISGSVAVFNLANNLSNILISAMAVSISTAIFPSLSLAYMHHEKTEFERKFAAAFLQLVFLTLPAAMLLFLLRAQVARVVWGSGEFGWTDTRLGAACLGVFAIGLCFQGLIFLLAKTFYAAHNTRIPAIVSAVTVGFNILMSFFFVWLLNAHGMFYYMIQAALKLQGLGDISVLGLALAFSITGIAEAILLLWLLYRDYKVFRAKVLFLSLSKIFGAAAAAAAACLAVRQGLVILNIIQLQTFIGVFLQLILSGLAGGLTYLGISYILQSQELKHLSKMFLSRKKVTVDKVP